MKCSQKMKSISGWATPLATNSAYKKCHPANNNPRISPVLLTPIVVSCGGCKPANWLVMVRIRSSRWSGGHYPDQDRAGLDLNNLRLINLAETTAARFWAHCAHR